MILGFLVCRTHVGEETRLEKVSKNSHQQLNRDSHSGNKTVFESFGD